MEVSLGDSCGYVTTAFGFFPLEVGISDTRKQYLE